MRVILFAAALVGGTAASAELRLPVIVPLGRASAPAPQLTGIDALRADFRARTGSDVVYFSGITAVLGAPALTTLQAQAAWLRQHPEVMVRIEGHSDTSDTRDHALAVGARRAEEVRNYLVLLGVPAAQISTVSWGKERPGPPRAVTVLALGAPAAAGAQP